MTTHSLVPRHDNLPTKKPPPLLAQSFVQPSDYNFTYTPPRYQVREVKQRNWRLPYWRMPRFINLIIGGMCVGALWSVIGLVMLIVAEILTDFIKGLVGGAPCYNGGFIEVITRQACLW
jgi:hypothetical protein